MAKVVFVCLRDPSTSGVAATAVAEACRRLLPDNLASVPPQVLESQGIVIGVSNPTPLLPLHRRAVLAGTLVDGGSWQACRSGRPEGSYALVRADDGCVEAVTDALASRSLWYALTDDAFIVSTSQRAITCLLGDFRANPDVIPWVLASGNLGPGLAWDRRVGNVPASSILSLDRRSWRLTLAHHPYRPKAPSAADPAERLRNEMARTFGALDVSDPRWAITLSGGVDCRAILCSLPRPQGLRSVTWGLPAALADPTNDAYLARELAAHFGLRHDFHPLELSNEPVERVLARFIACGEGRIDHISGYADGFQLWQKLVGSGVQGILRGDEAFGRDAVFSTWQARCLNEMHFWSDFSGLPTLESLGLPQQSIPWDLLRNDSETAPEWCDRSYREYRVPVVIAALSDLKLAYVEQANPLLSDGLVYLAANLPPRLRRSKRLFERHAISISPNVPFATNIAIPEGTSLLKSPRFVELLRDSLEGSLEPEVPTDLAALARRGLVTASSGGQVRRRRALPPALRRLYSGISTRLRAVAPPRARLDPNRLAFRVLMLSRALRQFRDDARSGVASIGTNATRPAAAGLAGLGHA